MATRSTPVPTRRAQHRSILDSMLLPALDRAPALDRVPAWRRLHARAHRERFAANTDENLFLGVYRSFDEALRDAPATRPIGYDNAASAELYAPVVCAWDYPALFWLGRAFAAGLHRVFDLGGHVGIKYLAFRRLQPMPTTLQWTVCDVPAVVARGRALAARRPTGGALSFTTDPAQLDGHEVLYVSGSLQYLPYGIGDLLRGLARPPRRIVLNLTPVHATRTYVTLNSIGTAVCPYRVFARDELVADVMAAGYRRLDEWHVLGKALALPLAPDLSLDHYTGFSFERTG